MGRVLVVGVVTAGLLWGATAGVSAHHAFTAEFDANRPVTLKGEVVRVEWINPHAWLHVKVKGKDGRPEEWMVELGPPGVLVRRGWTKTSVPVGMQIVAEGYQAKNRMLRANGRDVTLPDGHKLFVGSSGTGAPYDKPTK
jgi:hypothetical protein